MSTDLPSLTLAEAATLIVRRELSPVEITEACVARSEALDPALHAYLTKTFDEAVVAAKQAADDVAAGRYLGPLHGIPFGLKDLFETAGVRTTAGARLREHYVPDADATVVRRLRDAGVVVLGKLNMHEWALGATNINSHFPSPRNPWDTERITGGSSGGSAVAIAAGMCLGALGSDTGGSIRIPSSLCGITGLKPTYGRVSLRGVVPLSWSLDHAGPMARTALDCALILQAIAGFDPEDPSSAETPVPRYAAHLSPRLAGLRIGLPANFFFDEDAVDNEVSAAVRAAADAMKGLGATVDDVEVPGAETAARAIGAMLVADAAAYHQKNVADHEDLFDAGVLQRLKGGLGLGAVAYANARRVQAELIASLRRLFRDVDLLVLPTTPTVAPPFPAGDSSTVTFALTRNTGVFNLAGVPALSAPCGFDRQGLPIGMMIVGRQWDEALVLRAGFAYQQVTDWHLRRPKVV